MVRLTERYTIVAQNESAPHAVDVMMEEASVIYTDVVTLSTSILRLFSGFDPSRDGHDRRALDIALF